MEGIYVVQVRKKDLVIAGGPFPDGALARKTQALPGRMLTFRAHSEEDALYKAQLIVDTDTVMARNNRRAMEE